MAFNEDIFLKLSLLFSDRTKDTNKKSKALNQNQFFKESDLEGSEKKKKFKASYFYLTTVKIIYS